MHPILLELGPITLYTYGLLVATGFFVGITYCARLASREGTDPNVIYDMAFWAILAAIIGSRITFIILNYPYYLEHPFDVFKVWSGGLVFYGGFIGVAFVIYYLSKKKNVDGWIIADIGIHGGVLGHSIGRLGCLFAGCCYGQPTDVPWAIVFHDVHSIAPTGIHLHPTQLYSAFNEFSLFIILTLLRPYRKFKGQIFLTWLMLYAITRSIVESFRGDPRGIYFDGLISTSQIIAIFAFILGAWLYMRNKKMHPLT